VGGPALSSTSKCLKCSAVREVSGLAGRITAVRQGQGGPQGGPLRAAGARQVAWSRGA
jgi:hypothetical protein